MLLWPFYVLLEQEFNYRSSFNHPLSTTSTGYLFGFNVVLIQSLSLSLSSVPVHTLQLQLMVEPCILAEPSLNIIGDTPQVI